ncbi:MAG: DNA recombination protein RecN [Desulfovibrionales bacterium GWA2_65_9]|nr:MAG: DNA recombination protein RecN [Desulfovibrionales bacterium GWA2_65_9]
MLELLRIRDLALIEDAELEFAPGMNALTGETGAGKSFIVRAIDFLTGEPMSADLVRPGKDKAVVEAVFVVQDNGGPPEDLDSPRELIIRRELSADTGRSRVFVNDRLGSLDTLRDLRAGLVLHTSQHGQQKLLQPAHQARILDAFLPDPGVLAGRDAALLAVRAVQAARAELEAKVADLSRQREFLEFQRSEIAKVAPQPGEEDELLARKAGLKDHERLEEARGHALESLLGEVPLAAQVGELSRCLAQLTAFDPAFGQDKDVAEDFRHQLANLEARIRRLAAKGEGDDIEAIEARLFELAKLKRKLGKGFNDISEIVDLGRHAEENLSFLDSCALDAKRLEREEALAAQALSQALDALNAARAAAAEDLSARLGRELSGLGFSEHARVEFAFEPVEVYSGLTGVLSEQRGRLFWVPNPGQPPRPLDKIASGGELSRFLLALASLQAESAQPTLIFDEVDAGIGGHTLIRVGERLLSLAGKQQMILITHWPQLARLAKRHFLVRKDVIDGLTFTGCVRLGQAEIEAELVRMSGGESA